MDASRLLARKNKKSALRVNVVLRFLDAQHSLELYQKLWKHTSELEVILMQVFSRNFYRFNTR
jgi:hypothetical protein